MNLAIEKFSLLLEEKDELKKNDVSIKFIGNLDLLPKQLQKLINEIMLLTKDHRAKCLNICMAYTSSYEITNAANRLINAQAKNLISDKLDELSIQDFNDCLLTNRFKTDPELLVR